MKFTPADKAKAKNAILSALNEGFTTADDLAERAGRSPRSVYRLIRELKAEGVPIRGERGVGYMMRAQR